MPGGRPASRSITRQGAWMCRFSIALGRLLPGGNPRARRRVRPYRRRAARMSRHSRCRASGNGLCGTISISTAGRRNRHATPRVRHGAPPCRQVTSIRGASQCSIASGPAWSSQNTACVFQGRPCAVRVNMKKHAEIGEIQRRPQPEELQRDRRRHRLRIGGADRSDAPAAIPRAGGTGGEHAAVAIHL